MTVSRGLVLLAVLTATALTCLHLRTEKTRLEARMEQLRRERVELRRSLWSTQTEIARLRTPEQIRDRLSLWCLDVRAPSLEGEAGRAWARELAAR